MGGSSIAVLQVVVEMVEKIVCILDLEITVVFFFDNETRRCSRIICKQQVQPVEYVELECCNSVTINNVAQECKKTKMYELVDIQHQI